MTNRMKNSATDRVTDSATDSAADSATDSATDSAADSAKTRLKIRLLDALSGVLIVIAAGSVVLMVCKVSDSRDNDAGLESLAQIVAVAPGDITGAGAAGAGALGGGIGADSEEAERAALLALRKQRQERYALLRQQNPDMIGWLSIEDTRINYPVTQSVDRPNFYLTHNFQKEKSAFGNPYLAETCGLDGTSDNLAGEPDSLAGTSDNLIIYGHHMKDGSMFAGLMKYAKEEYYQEHPVIRFDTLTELGDYEILGVFAPSADDKNAAFYRSMYASSRTEFEAYVAEVNRRKYYNTGVSASYGDRLLTLITCEYSQKNGRLVVVARKMEDS